MPFLLKSIRESGSTVALELSFYRAYLMRQTHFLVSISLYFHTPGNQLPDSLELNDWSPIARDYLRGISRLPGPTGSSASTAESFPDPSQYLVSGIGGSSHV